MSLVINNYALDSDAQDSWRIDNVIEGVYSSTVETFPLGTAKSVVEARAAVVASELGLSYDGMMYERNAQMRLRS